MKTRIDKVKAIIDGSLAAKMNTVETLQIALQMCQDAGNIDLYEALLPVYERKKEEKKEYIKKKVAELQEITWFPLS